MRPMRHAIFSFAAASLALVLLAHAPPALAEEPAPAGEAPAPAREAPAPDPAEVLKQVLKDLASKDESVRLKAVVQAKDIQSSKLLRSLSKALKDKLRPIRMAAIDALGARTTPAEKKKAAKLLLDRLNARGGASDSEERVALAEGVGTLEVHSSLRPLLDPIDLETPPEELKARMDAVVNIPSKEAVERLITILDKGRRAARSRNTHAVKALRMITGQQFDRNPDRWRSWWRDVGPNFDFDAVREAREDEARRRAEAEAEREAKRKAKQERKRRKNRNKPPEDEAGDGETSS